MSDFKALQERNLMVDNLTCLSGMHDGKKSLNNGYDRNRLGHKLVFFPPVLGCMCYNLAISLIADKSPVHLGLGRPYYIHDTELKEVRNLTRLADTKPSGALRMESGVPII